MINMKKKNTPELQKNPIYDGIEFEPVAYGEFGKKGSVRNRFVRSRLDEMIPYQMSYNKVLDRGYDRHPYPAEVFSLLADSLEGKLKGTPLQAVADDISDAGNEWLQTSNSNVRIKFDFDDYKNKNNTVKLIIDEKTFYIENVQFENYLFRKNLKDLPDELVKYLYGRPFNDLPEKMKKNAEIALPKPYNKMEKIIFCTNYCFLLTDDPHPLINGSLVNGIMGKDANYAHIAYSRGVREVKK